MKAIICVLVTVVLICGGTAALGADLYFNPTASSGNWTDGDDWKVGSCGGADGTVPGATDDATICTGKTCTLDISDEVMTISTQPAVGEDPPGKLIIPAAYTLTLNEHTGVSTIDGTIELTGEIHIVIDLGAGHQEWHRFDGSGEIIGKAGTAKILIQTAQGPTPNELLVSTTIRGILEIGKLVSDQNDQTLVLKGGSVVADDHGTLKITTGAMRDELDLGARSLLKVWKFSDAVLQIDVGCSGTPPLASFCKIFCLEYTDAEILEGTLDLDTGIITEGDLTMEPGGVFDVDEDASAWFRFADCSAI